MQPDLGVFAMYGEDFVQESHVLGSSREYWDEILEAGKVELGDDRIAAMLDQAAAALGLEVSDDLVFPFRQLEGVAVVLFARLVVRKKDAGGCLLNECVADGALDGALDVRGNEDHDGVELPQRLQPILDLRREIGSIEELPA